MRVASIIGFAFALSIAGCSGFKPASPAAQLQGAPEAPVPVVSAPATPAITRPVEPLAPEAVNPPATPVAAGSSAVDAAPATKAPAPVAAKSRAAPPAKMEPAASTKKEPAAPDVAKKSAPTLDLASLEQRLKDTSAIGVLTKISLKNQVDDLLDQFRAFYQGKLKTTLAELRKPYDRLVLKVLALLQDSDPSLASAIVASREAIWGILSDPVKFATI